MSNTQQNIVDFIRKHKSNTPYLKEVINIINDDKIKNIVIMKSRQPCFTTLRSKLVEYYIKNTKDKN